MIEHFQNGDSHYREEIYSNVAMTKKALSTGPDPVEYCTFTHHSGSAERMENPVLIPGGLAIDDRGAVGFANEFNFDQVRRSIPFKSPQWFCSCLACTSATRRST